MINDHAASQKDSYMDTYSPRDTVVWGRGMGVREDNVGWSHTQITLSRKIVW